jgi:hypothetical protein
LEGVYNRLLQNGFYKTSVPFQQVGPMLRHRTLVFSAALRFVLFSASAAQAQTFGVTNYSVGPNPNKLVRGDFNHDGLPDLATANGDGTVTILLNNGNGTFRRVDAAAGVPLSAGGQGLRDIFPADFNHDGLEDLLVLNVRDDGSADLNVLLGRGDGSFTAPRTIVNKMGGAVAVAADFNGDGNLDVAFAYNTTVPNPAPLNGAHSQANIAILFGDGTGAFHGEQDLQAVGAQDDYSNGGVGYRINSMNVGDFNGDAHTDFAFGECCGGSDVAVGAAFVFFSNGDGTFKPKQLQQGGIPHEVRVADIDRDGATDILTPWAGCHTPCMGVYSYTNIATNSQAVTLPFPKGETDQFGSATLGTFGGARMVAYTAEGSYATASGATTEGAIAFASYSAGSYTLVSQFGTDKLLHWLISADFNGDGNDDLTVLPLQDASAPAGRVEVFTYGASNAGSTCSASADRTVNICSPANGGTFASPVRILAGLRSDAGITAAQIYLDGAKILQAPAGTSTIDQSLSMSAGSHRITVKGWDHTGSFSSTVNITVGTTSGGGSCTATSNRTVKICSPAASATVFSPVHVLASLHSDSGVKTTQIYLDGTKVFQATAATLIDQQLSMGAGSHKITVKGWDRVGSFSSSVAFTVN